MKSIQIVGAFDNAPVTDSDFELLGSTTRMNATLNFSISDAGKSIGYRFRYLNTKDQPGPWTTTLAAKILKWLVQTQKRAFHFLLKWNAPFAFPN